MCAADLFVSEIVVHVCAPDSVRSFEEYENMQVLRKVMTAQRNAFFCGG